ncbi:hypothetical protein N0V95_005962 [Ascochyta clinopodiicola]|nr:hypothetical protein N0V95_005962 [Ascochyta clinopodiicola]
MAAGNSFPIPQPKPGLFLGNVGDINPNDAPGSFQKLAEIHGEIFQLDLPGRKTIVCSSYDTINDLCDASRFEKPIDGALKEVRALTGDGLFTAYPGEKMFGDMMDCAAQMLLRWDRFGPAHEISCSDDFTRLAFEMIGLCAFGYRFNNFYSPTPHPFVEQMVDVLVECGRRGNRPGVENTLRFFSAARLHDNVAKMHALCDQIIADRVKHPQPDAEDLLNHMLNDTDQETGEKMTHESVRYNMVTFLVAGHETTSGTLGFLFYHLLNNPETYLRAQKEVDDVLGDAILAPKHLYQLVYVKYAIYEALRFMGPIGLNAKRALRPTMIAGKYHVDPEHQILMNLHGLHHDPKIWGDDADTFRPERFLDGNWESLPPNAWKPFGDGPRACIGRGFAEQEMIMIVALILQKFQVEMADPTYKLRISVTLTMKPLGLNLKVRRRPGRTMASLGDCESIATRPAPFCSDSGHINTNTRSLAGDLKFITVLYGSQAGTCKAYAEELQTNAPRYGFQASISTLDSATEHVPKDQPVIIIQPSYEGKPAENARKFVSWLETNACSSLLRGVRYAIFGVGNSNWSTSYQRVPKLTDKLFETMGAERFFESGFVDVQHDIFGPWEDWAERMWSALRELNGTTTEVKKGGLSAGIRSPKFATVLGGSDIGYGIIKANKSLGGEGVGLLKKHIDIELPIGSSYRSGDYMVVLALNNIATVKRVIKRFDLPPDDNIEITNTSKAFLVSDGPLSVFDLLMTRVELGTPISQKQIQALADTLPRSERDALIGLADNDIYHSSVLSTRYSILDMLESYPNCQLPFADYLDMLKPLSPRQYSISSSPIANIRFMSTPQGSAQILTASLTYDVHEEPAWSNPKRCFYGVASTYLARLEPGDRVRCFTRSTNANFHLPLDFTTPIIMVCAGSGLAPMRGFIQERATVSKARNTTLGPMILYFGCRHYEKDYIYKAELAQWESDGVVSVRPCFSKVGPEGSQKYVPDRIWEDREELARLFGVEGAKILVCGSASKLAKSVAEVCKKIWQEKHPDKSDESAQEWLEMIKEDRYVSDVFE